MVKDQKIALDNLNLSSIACGIVSSIDDVRDHNFIAKGLGSVPYPLQSRIARKYVERYKETNPKLKYEANRWFDRTIKKLKPRFNVLFRITQNMPLPWYILSNKDKTKKHADITARACINILLESSDDGSNEEYETILRNAYENIGKYSSTMHVTPDHWAKRNKATIAQLESALLKVQCEKWWATKLKTVRAQYLELLEISTGEVGRDLYRVRNKKTKKVVVKRKGISPYSSKQAQNEYRDSQKSGREYLSRLELENQDGEVIDLVTAVDKGMANPVNRRNELMLRLRETEEIADEMNYVGVFYTMTCPSKYHANSDKWQGSSPKEAQRYLVKVWQRARAKLNRLDINYFGLRVAEPHADGCPHWHMLLFMPRNKHQMVTAILRKYFIAEDTEELRKRYGPLVQAGRMRCKSTTKLNKWNTGFITEYTEFSKPTRQRTEREILFKAYKQKRRLYGKKKKDGVKPKAPDKFYRTFNPRFTAIAIDKSIGSAAGYIAKYISKNIDGYQVHDHEDAETGENIKVNPVLAWASTWGIHQFQFQGSPSVTIYRELRKVREPVAQFDLERIRQAADNAQWKTFVELMGGMCIGRNANFRTAYEETILGNKYAETTRVIKGVVTNTSAVAQALREMRGEVNVSEDATLLTRVSQWTKQLKGTAEKRAAQERGFVGFADQSWTSGNNCTPLKLTTSAESKLGMLGLSENQISALKKGCRVRVDDNIYAFIDHQLRIFTIDHIYEKRKKDEIDHFASVNAIKSGRIEPNKHDWQQARDLVGAAFSHAMNDGRTLPNDLDWQYARNVETGEVELDWWDAGLMLA